MITRTTFLGFISLLAVLLSQKSAPAQSYSLEWAALAGGGGTSAGGTFAALATLGQSDAAAGATIGGSFSFLGGFWSLFAVSAPVTPAGPQLTITRNYRTPEVTISWPSSATGFTLQRSFDLDGKSWELVPQFVTDNGTTKYIVVSFAGANRFYRLSKP